MASNNVIENDAGELFGFYSDILEYLKSELVDEINNNNFSVISPDWADLMGELTKLENYGGIIKISDNNGMGWTATKYQYKEN